MNQKRTTAAGWFKYVVLLYPQTFVWLVEKKGKERAATARIIQLRAPSYPPSPAVYVT